MLVNKSFTTKDGVVKFDGELSQEEADFVIGLGLNQLLMQGAIPFTTSHAASNVAFVPVDTECDQ